jgi:hypothetical protein
LSETLPDRDSSKGNGVKTRIGSATAAVVATPSAHDARKLLFANGPLKRLSLLAGRSPQRNAKNAFARRTPAG